MRTIHACESVIGLATSCRPISAHLFNLAPFEDQRGHHGGGGGGLGGRGGGGFGLASIIAIALAGLVAIATAHITLRDVDGAGVGTVVRTWVATVIASVVAAVISAYVTVIANVGFAIVSAVRQAPCFCGLGANYAYCGNNYRGNNDPD